MANVKNITNYLTFLTILLCPLISLGHLGHDHAEAAGDTVVVDPKWTDAHKIPLKQEVGVDLQWTSTDKERVTMKMSSKTEGYVAIGFCSRWLGTMQGCDIVLGWVDNQNGTAYLHDYHATGNSLPVLDETQNYELVDGNQKDGITTITFSRKWNTGDDNNDADLEHNSVHVMYAWHPEDPTSPEKFHRHAVGSRGHTNTAISFKDHKAVDEKQSSGAESFMTTWVPILMSHLSIYFLF